MKRILSVLTVAALAAATMVVMAAPAMAQSFGFDDHDDNDFNNFGFLGDDDDDFNGHNFNGFNGFNGFGGFGGLDVENEAESGDVDLSFSVENTGDFASQCVPATQFGNSGNFNNAPSFFQFGSLSDDFEADGIEVSFAPETTVDCSSTVQQSSAASS